MAAGSRSLTPGVVLVPGAVWDRDEEHCCQDDCGHSKGLGEWSSRDLNLQPVVDIHLQILLEGFQRGHWASSL